MSFKNKSILEISILIKKHEDFKYFFNELYDDYILREINKNNIVVEPLKLELLDNIMLNLCRVIYRIHAKYVNIDYLDYFNEENLFINDYSIVKDIKEMVRDNINLYFDDYREHGYFIKDYNIVYKNTKTIHEFVIIFFEHEINKARSEEEVKNIWSLSINEGQLYNKFKKSICETTKGNKNIIPTSDIDKLIKQVVRLSITTCLLEIYNDKKKKK